MMNNQYTYTHACAYAPYTYVSEVAMAPYTCCSIFHTPSAIQFVPVTTNISAWAAEYCTDKKFNSIQFIKTIGVRDQFRLGGLRSVARILSPLLAPASYASVADLRGGGGLGGLNPPLGLPKKKKN